MEITLNSNEIHEVLRLSKADNITFVNKNGITYIISSDQEDISNTTQIIKSFTDNYRDKPGQVSINKNVLKLIPQRTEVLITGNIIIAGKRKIKYKNNDIINVPILVGNYLTSISTGEFKYFLNCDYAIAKDQVRPIFNSICINNGEFVAIDGFRMVIRKGNFETKKQLIVSADMVKILKKVKANNNIKIYYDDNYIKFQFGNLEVIGNRIHGDYIKYKNIIPEDYTTKVKLETKSVLNILKDYKKNKFEIIKLNFQKDNLIISASNETTSIEDSLPINLEGKDLEIAFKIDYLIDTFKNYNNPILELTSRVSPMIVKEDNKLDLVLPFRI